MKKKILSVFLVVAMVAAMIPAFGMAASATETTEEATDPNRDKSWYSDDKTSFTISTAAQLLGFSDLLAAGTTFSGKTVTLGADIDLNPGWTAGATDPPTNAWGNTANYTDENEKVVSRNFAGTFNGNKKTISGIYLNISTGAGGIFGNAQDGAQIYDLVILNSYVNASVSQVGGIFGLMSGGKVSISNVYCDVDFSFGDQYSGGFVGWLFGGTLTIDNCVFAGNIVGTKTSNAMLGGFVGYMGHANTSSSDPATLNISNSAFYGSIKGHYIGGIVGKLGHTNDTVSKANISNFISAGRITQLGGYVGMFYGGTSGTATIAVSNSYYTSLMGSDGVVYKIVCSSSSAVKKPTTTSMYYNIDDASLIGTLDNVPNLANFTATENGYPRPTAIVEMTNGIYDRVTSWYDSEKDSFTLSTAQQLLGFSDLLAAGTTFTGETITLGADIDLNEGWTAGATAPLNRWADVGGKVFAGTFDGNNHIIDGVHLLSYNRYIGMFGKVMGAAETPAVIKNLGVVNSYVGSVYNVDIGGLAGVTSNASFENLYLDIDVVGVGKDAGGIANETQNTVMFKNCVVVGNVSSTEKVGGIVGYNSSGNITMENCAFYGNASATKNSAGLLLGYSNSTTCTLTFKNCVAGGTLTYGTAENAATENRCGALYGVAKAGCTIQVEGTYFVPITVNGKANEERPYPVSPSTAESAMPEDSRAGLTYKTNDDFKGINATKPDGFVSMPEGYAMPVGVVNMVSNMKHVNADTALDGFETSYAGFQQSTMNLDLRLVGLVSIMGTDSTLDAEYKGVGFDVEMITESGKTWNNKVAAEGSDVATLPIITTVYSSVLEAGKTEPTAASDIGGDYIFVATVSGIKANVGTLTFVVKTFHDGVDGARVYDDIYVISYDTTVAEAE